MFTDYFDQPLNPGDKVAVAYGGSGASLKTHDLVELVPLVPHRDFPSNQDVLMRADQSNIPRPTQFRRYNRAPEKLFVAKIAVNKWRSERKGGPLPSTRSIHDVMTIIKAPQGSDAG